MNKNGQMNGILYGINFYNFYNFFINIFYIMLFKKYLNAHLPTFFNPEETFMNRAYGFDGLRFSVDNNGNEESYMRDYEKEAFLGGYSAAIHFYYQVDNNSNEPLENGKMIVFKYFKPDKFGRNKEYAKEYAIIQLLNQNKFIKHLTIPAFAHSSAKKELFTEEQKELFTEEKNKMVIMKAADGDLFELIIEKTKKVEFPVDVNNVLLQIIRGLYLLKKNKMYYTDLKLENIFYTSINNQIKIYLGDLGSIIYYLDDDIEKPTVRTYIHPDIRKINLKREDAEKMMVFCLGLIMFVLKFKDDKQIILLIKNFEYSWYPMETARIREQIIKIINTNIADEDPYKQIMIQIFNLEELTIDEIHHEIFENNFMKSIFEEENKRCSSYETKKAALDNNCIFIEPIADEDFIRKEMNAPIYN